MNNLLAEQIAGNAGWPFQFRFAVHGIWSRVPEFTFRPRCVGDE